MQCVQYSLTLFSSPVIGSTEWRVGTGWEWSSDPSSTFPKGEWYVRLYRRDLFFCMISSLLPHSLFLCLSCSILSLNSPFSHPFHSNLQAAHNVFGVPFLLKIRDVSSSTKIQSHCVYIVCSLVTLLFCFVGGEVVISHKQDQKHPWSAWERIWQGAYWVTIMPATRLSLYTVEETRIIHLRWYCVCAYISQKLLSFSVSVEICHCSDNPTFPIPFRR